ncbi:MAG: hypothetical protein M0017_02265 [Desulfobacteraceae bacterium]|nr:hypothetical protein [Desulfobacteraceae bacterium]
MELTIEEAVQRVKAEIIAPDWRLNARRVESLEEAFACLGDRFRNRKGLKAILTMAGNVLEYVKARGDNSPPDSIDFLKEAMADVVNLYEETDYNPEREERVFRKVFSHFQSLKGKIKSHQERRPPLQPGPGTEPDQTPLAAEAPGPAAAGEQPLSELPPGEASAAGGGPVLSEAERLLADLHRTLRRAEEVGAALQELVQAAGGRPGNPAESPSGPPAEELPAASAPEEPTGLPEGAGLTYKKCPPSGLREILIGDRALGIPEESVALIRPLPVKAREKYLRGGQVPLRDFRRLFASLARQFEGMLATMPDRKLKKLVLPVASLQAVGLPEVPDDQATTLVVLSYGHWHGVLLCSGVREELRVMTGFRKAPNGDLAGVGALEGGGELPVVSAPELLRREGFLAIV